MTTMKTFVLSIALVLSATFVGADDSLSPRLEFNSAFDPEVKKAVEFIQSTTKPKNHTIDFKMMFDKITSELENALTFEGMDFFWIKADQAISRLDRKTTHRNLTTTGVVETNLLGKATVDARLACFDTLKNSTKKVNGLLVYAVKHTNDTKYLNRLRNYQIKLDGLQNRIVKARTDFLSYDVVSPTIAYTHSRIRKDRNHFTRIRGHLNTFSRRIHMDFIYESSEEVRLTQFLQLMRYAKEQVTEQQWSDIITETTLTDSIDRSKARGGDSWWEK